MNKKKSFRVTKRRVIYDKGPFLLADYAIKMGTGETISRQILEHWGCAFVIPKISKTRYLLIRQFRFPARQWLWELPGGGMSRKETPRQCAHRELIEETGYRARRLKKILHYYPSPGALQEKMHLFLAEDLVPAEAEGDEDVEVEVRDFSLKEMEQMVNRGKIVDGKTIIAYYYLKLHGGRRS